MGKKQWLILFLMMASAIFFWNVNCYAAEESEKDDISYTFNSETDTLSIHGSGEMTETPWLTDTAFKSYRKNVKNIIIEEGITSICSKACGFDHILSNLTSDIEYLPISVQIPSTVISIDQDAFGSRISEINVSDNNTIYSSVDGVLFDKNQTTLLKFPSGNNTWISDAYKNVAEDVEVGTPYNAKQDGWCVGNYARYFGSNDYKLNPQIYHDVYKNLFFTGMGKQIISALAPYSGNCFGLAATSALNFEGYLNLNKYFHNLPGSLADYGYNSILTNDEGKKYYSLQGNAEAINWVERMMVSQFSTALSKMEIYNSDLDKLITNLQEGVSFSIFVNMEYYLGGHTVVIDNRYKFSC